jgi:hypothetical protein
MTIRSPSPPPSLRDHLNAALDYEIAQEKASALGRLGRALEAALAALAAFDMTQGEGNADCDARSALVARASSALWYFVVQREACGMRDYAQVVRNYRVPPEVQARMGAFPSRPR